MSLARNSTGSCSLTMDVGAAGLDVEFPRPDNWIDKPSLSRLYMSEVVSRDHIRMAPPYVRGNKSSRRGGVQTIEQDKETTPERVSRRHAKGTRKSSATASEFPEFSQSQSLRQRVNVQPRGESPRRTRAEEDDLQDVLAEIIHEQSLTLARAARKKDKSDRQGKPEAEELINGPPSGRGSPRTLRKSRALTPGTGESQEENLVKGAGRRAKTRRQKRKADSVLADGQSLPGFHHLQDLQQLVPTTTPEHDSISRTWIQLFDDIIMWTDVPRSTFLFGAGCFCIFSASYMQDACCGTLTVTAYMALVYLGAVFFHRNFLRGDPSDDVGSNWEIGESEAFLMLKAMLPAVNMVLNKCGQLFCGDPSTTLKVACILWLLAQAGHFMTIWSFFRFFFVLMFIVPKLYSSYSHKLHEKAEAYLDRLWLFWSVYSHKKAAVFGTLALAWNLSSAAFRLYGAFVLLVTIKLYANHSAELMSDLMEGDQSPPVNDGQLEERLVTPTTPRSPYSPLQKSLPPLKTIKIEPE